MAIDDYLSSINQAPNTPFGGGGGSFGGSGSGGRTPNRPVQTVWMGSNATSSRVPISTTTTRERRGASNAQRIDGGVPSPGRTTGRKVNSAPGVVLADDIREADVVKGMVAQWYGTPAFDRWGQHLLKLGLIDPGDETSFEILDEAWRDAVDLASRFPPSKRITPFEAARLMAGTGGAAGRGGGRGGGGGSRYGTAREAAFTGARAVTSRQSNVDLTDPKTAKAIVNQALSQFLGRNATDEEVAAFTVSINASERANPTVSDTTTTTSYRDGEQVSQSSNSTTSGGLTGAARQQIVADEAMQKPEYGAYQAASTYWNALQQSLGAIV